MSSGWTTLLALWAGITGALMHVARTADESLLPEPKRALVNWLDRLDLTISPRGWEVALRLAFNRAFGSFPLSLKAITRSSIASLAAFLLCAGLWLVRHPEALALRPLLLAFGTLASLIGVTIAVTLVPGFIALLSTRAAMHYAVTTRRLLIVLLLDLCATSLIGWLAVLPFLAILGSDAPNLYAFTHDVLTLAPDGRNVILAQRITASETIAFVGPLVPQAADHRILGHLPLGLWYYSTFGSSLWLWLAVASAGLVKIAFRLNLLTRHMKRHLSYQEQPVRVIALMLVVLISVLLLISVTVLAI